MVSYYKKMERPPADALKRIEGGDIKGMTDIKPQWRYEIMDETFGACGIGWKYEIVKLWDYPTAEGTVLCFAQLNVYIKDGDKWSDPIPGTGGNTLVDMVKGFNQNDPKRAKPNDEGYKMAITDALSSALRMIGVAAAIYRGEWDGSKYRSEKQEEKPQLDKGHLDALAAIMKKTRADGSQYFTDEQKAGYKKKIGVYGLTETLKQAEIALEELEAAE